MDVSRLILVVSRPCIAHGTNLVYTAGCLVGCSLWLSGDAERKRSGVGVDSEQERRSPVVRALRSCYDRILFDNKSRTDVVRKACHFGALNLNRYPLRRCCYAGTLDIEAYDNNIARIVDIEVGDIGGIIC